MFEGSLVESRGLVISETRRWTAVGSLTVQLAVAGLLLAFPLMRPQILPVLESAPKVALPFPVRPPVVVQQVRTAASAANAMSAPVAAGPVVEATRLLFFPRPGEATGEAAPTFDPNLKMGSGGAGSLGMLFGPSLGSGSMVTVVRERESKPRVSEGVSLGMLITPLRPVYPAIARMARVQGTVVVEATISKVGRIESLHAMSGPEMLRRAALDAVAPARFRPYLLNGEPTDVETIVTVVFMLGS